MSRDTTVIPFRQPEAIDDPLTEVAGEGARRMLAQVLIAEADAFVAQWKDLKLPGPPCPLRQDRRGEADFLLRAHVAPVAHLGTTDLDRPNPGLDCALPRNRADLPHHRHSSRCFVQSQGDFDKNAERADRRRHQS
jgi:hypothetical protein